MRTLVIFLLTLGAVLGQNQLGPLRLSDPDADRVVWWDDSENRLDWAIPAELRAWLDLEIGTDVMRYDADLDDLADGSLTAAKVGIADAGGNYDATDLEAVLAEIAGGVIGGGDAVSIDGNAVVDPNFTSDRDIAFFDDGGGDWSLYIKAGTILLADLSATLQSQLTLDTEWDTAAKINAKTTDEDFLVDSDIGSAVQAWSAILDGTTASFLVADETKLGGIEAGADVTDAANVLAALAANADPLDLNGQNITNVGAVDGRDVSADGALVDTALQPADVGTAAAADLIDDDTMATATAANVPSSESIKAYVDAEVAGASGTGDSVLVDGGNTTDPDFVSTGDIDFVNTSNTITADIRAGVIDLAKLDASLQASIALADSAIQPADIDTTAKINALTTDEDFLVDSDVGVTVQGYDADLDDLATDGVLSAARIDDAITRDTEWDTPAKINAAMTGAFLVDDADTVGDDNIDWATVTLADLVGAQVAPAISFNFSSVASLTLPDAVSVDGVWSWTFPADDGNSGDVLSTDGAGVTSWVPPGSVADDAITNAKLANMATSTIKGRATAGTGDPEDLTAAQVRTLLNVEDGATADQSDAEIETAYNNQVPAASQAEMEAGTETAIRRVSPSRMAEAIAALVGDNFDLHVADVSNPHSVTAAQAGATPFHDAAVDPTVNDDVTSFTEGTIWRNNQGTSDESDDTFFQLLDDTDTAAVWVPMVRLTAAGALDVASLDVSGDLSAQTLTVSGSTAPNNTTEGRIQWDTDDDQLVIGTGASTITIGTGGSGDVTAASAFGTDNRLIRSDGVDKGVQSSGITVTDANAITGATIDGDDNTLQDIPPSALDYNEFGLALSDLVTSVTAGGDVVGYWDVPFDLTITGVWAYALVAPTGSGVSIDVHLGAPGAAGTTIMSTNKISIDATTYSSLDAATPPGITTTAATAGQRLTWYLDAVGSTEGGKGIQAWISYTIDP